jgi:hypothetical protein
MMIILEAKNVTKRLGAGAITGSRGPRSGKRAVRVAEADETSSAFMRSAR